MVTLTTGMLVVLLIAGGITALAMLSVFANVIEHETELHDLRNRVRELHFQYAMYMARSHGQIEEESQEGDVEIIEDDAEELLESTEALASQLAQDATAQAA